MFATEIARMREAARAREAKNETYARRYGADAKLSKLRKQGAYELTAILAALAFTEGKVGDVPGSKVDKFMYKITAKLVRNGEPIDENFNDLCASLAMYEAKAVVKPTKFRKSGFAWRAKIKRLGPTSGRLVIFADWLHGPFRKLGPVRKSAQAISVGALKRG
jgi:hypothetical protein